MSKPQRFPRQRQHTLLFLEHSRAYRPVVIDTEVEMTQVVQHRRQSGGRFSYFAYFIQAMSQVVAQYPEANSLFLGRFLPRLVSLDAVNAKFTVDKTAAGQRIVASAVVESADSLSLEDIQRRIDDIKAQEIAEGEAFAPIRKLHSMPLLLARLLFRYAMWRPAIKSRVQGTFTITSLGGRAVTRFIPLPGSTLTLGVGDIAERPLVKNGRLSVAHTTTLTLVFDHRVLDGAISAEILAKIKEKLESVVVCNLENPGRSPTV